MNTPATKANVVLNKTALAVSNVVTTPYSLLKGTTSSGTITTMTIQRTIYKRVSTALMLNVVRQIQPRLALDQKLVFLAQFFDWLCGYARDKPLLLDQFRRNYRTNTNNTSGR